MSCSARKRGLGVLLLDGPEGGRRGEQRPHAVLGDHPPEGPGVGGADRLALVEHGRGAGDERPVDDVGVPDDPAHVRRGPEDVAGASVVDVGHAPRQRHGVAAVVAHHALGPARGARGVEDVERIGGGHGDAVDRRGARPWPRPSRRRAAPMVAVGLRALEDDAGGRACARPARWPGRAAACTR